MDRRPRRSVLSRALFGGSFALVLLLTVEVGLRIAGVRPAYRVEDLGQWRVNGNLVNHATSGPRDGHPFTLTTNADGLRTRLPMARAHGKRRIALMGDSTVFGWGVDEGETVADGVQSVLGDSAEVLNAGQPGYSTTMMSWFFHEVVKDYQPDLTIVFIPMHDTNLVLVSDREVLDGGATPLATVRVGLAQQSRIYQLIRGILFNYTDKAWLLPNEPADEPRVPRVSDDERTAALDDMVREMAAWGGELRIGYLPFKGDIEDRAGMQRPSRPWATAWAAAHHSEILDASQCCIGQSGLVLADDPGHLSSEGNQKAGASIAANLLQSGARQLAQPTLPRGTP